MSFVSFYKHPLKRGYSTGTYLIEDTSATSPLYFDIQEFPRITGGGRYVIKLKGSGAYLQTGSVIDVEILDADGNNIFCEVTNYVDRFDNYYITLEIYDITIKGMATAYFVGRAIADENGNPIKPSIRPTEDFNLRWTKKFSVLPTERNTADLIFDEPPIVGISQVTLPERSLTSELTTGSVFTVFTSSIDDFKITTSNTVGYDRDFASSKNILDPRLQSIITNPLQTPSTNNSVNTALRQNDNDIENGYLKDYSTRFGTIVTSAGNNLIKDFLGGAFNFFSEGTTPSTLLPTPPDNYTISGSSASQLKLFAAAIVEVMSDKNMRISKPVELDMLNSRSIRRGYTTSYKYKDVNNFTASVTHLESDAAFITSSTVSQSYIETTFLDMKPISGDVYRIKSYYKKGIASAEFKLISDNVVQPVEYLTDAAFPNQTAYAKRDSDYRLLGHFTDQDIAGDYWEFSVEIPAAIYLGVMPTITNSILSESIPIQADFTESGVLATQYNQNYNFKQLYTIGFNLALDPGAELEVYMGSDPLSTSVTVPVNYARAFIKDNNVEKTRHGGDQNRFGKYIGKVKNNRSVSRYYGRVEFDFETDGEGFGRPVLRSNTINREDIIANAYVSEISIKPLTINGFSPNLVQYAIPFNNEIDDLIALSQSLDMKFEYFDYTGKQSEFVTYLNDIAVNIKSDIPSNTCQGESAKFWTRAAEEG